MSELTVDEAIAAGANEIEKAVSYRFSRELAATLWHEWFSRVRPAATAPEVAYGPCELRPGVWAAYDKYGTFLRYRDAVDHGPTGVNYRYVRVGDVPACPPPNPAPLPPKPELACYRVSVGRDAGIVFWAVTSELGVLRDTKTGDVIAVEFCQKVEVPNADK